MTPSPGGRDDSTAELGVVAQVTRARRFIPGGVNSGQRRVAGLEDLVVVATDGATFTDARGRTYTDYHAAFGPAVLGHNYKSVDDAVVETARSVDLMGVGVTPVEIDLAERICANVPSVESVLLTSSGSEATFHALRVARVATGRRYIVKFQGCYHGWHDSVAMNVISLPERVGHKDPISGGILQDVVDSTIVCPFNDPAAVEQALDDYDVAAVILEPVPHNIGCVLPLPGFLERVRELCTSHGTVLIFDEVVTGFRHGLAGYQGHVNVAPDLTTLGKSIANGYPIVALGGRADLMDLFSTTPGRPAFFAGTYNGHPGMAAAALATIDVLENEPVYEHIFALGERARQGLRKLYAELGVKAHVTGFGSVFVTYFLDGPVNSYEDLLANDAEFFCAYRLALMEHGIFELPLNLKRNHVSFAHTERDIDDLVAATGTVVSELVSRRGELGTTGRLSKGIAER